MASDMSEVDTITSIGPISIKIKLSLIEIMPYYITYLSHIFVFILDLIRQNMDLFMGLDHLNLTKI